MPPLAWALVSLAIGWTLVTTGAALLAGLAWALLVAGVPFVLFSGVVLVRLIRGR